MSGRDPKDPPHRPPAKARNQRGRGLGSTYRLQLDGFGFEKARKLVGYLHELGVEVLYVSPISTAAPGSTHGYDVVDPNSIDPALGGPEGLEALLSELADHNMRLLVDVVPNHMATSSSNRWWWDVLRLGPTSPHARYFDIDWEAGGGRVMLPVLGAPLSEVLDAGDLCLSREDDGGWTIAYYDQRFPLSPETEEAGQKTQPKNVTRQRQRTRLMALLDQQHYRLAYSRLASQEVNYRRFFDIDGLVGLRVEDPEVYRATHRLALELAADPRVAGLRLDHIDGLADPTAYLDRLRADLDQVSPSPPVLLVEKIVARNETLPAAWPVDGMTGYEFADLAGGLMINPAGAAALEEWGRIASTGGDMEGAEPSFQLSSVQAKREVLSTLFAGQLHRLAQSAAATIACDHPGVDLAEADIESALSALTVELPVYRTYLDGSTPTPADRRLIRSAVARASLTLDDQGRRALNQVVDGLLGEPERTDRRKALEAPTDSPAWLNVARGWQQLTGAVTAKGVEDTALYRFDGLLAAAEVGGNPGAPAVDPDAFHRSMVQRAHQLPGSLNATSTHDTKRSEDVRARLAVLSEMPGRWSEQVDRWRRRYGGELSGSGPRPSPHDELAAYQAVVGTWPPEEGGRRQYNRRLQDYLVKAAREAKRETSWFDPDPSYERGLRRLVGHLLGPSGIAFQTEVTRLVATIGPAGVTNVLAQLVLKCTAPGVPDLYQGNELWSPALVDPDNRHPVAFGDRLQMLETLVDQMESDKSAAGTGIIRTRRRPCGSRFRLASRLLRQWPEGVVKLYVTKRLLQLRQERPKLFDQGTYQPLKVIGSDRAHVVAFSRHHRGHRVLTVVPRLSYQLAGPGHFPVADRWSSATVVELAEDGPRKWTDVLTGFSVTATGSRLAVGDLLGSFPVAVLVED